MVGIHTTKWKPLLILAGVSKKEEADLSKYETDNFLGVSKAGIPVNGVPLLTRAIDNYFRARSHEGTRIGHIEIWGPREKIEPYLPKIPCGTAIRIVDEESTLGDKLRGMHGLGELFPKKGWFFSPVDLAPTVPDIERLMTLTDQAERERPNLAAVYPAIKGRPLVDIGFRMHEWNKLYTARDEHGEKGPYAFTQMWYFHPERIMFEEFGDVTDKVHALRGEGIHIRNVKIMYKAMQEAFPDIPWHGWVRAAFSMLGLIRCWPAPKMSGLESIAAYAVNAPREGSIVIHPLEASSLAMDVDCKKDLAALEAHYRKSEASSFEALYREGGLEPW